LWIGKGLGGTRIGSKEQNQRDSGRDPRAEETMSLGEKKSRHERSSPKRKFEDGEEEEPSYRRASKRDESYPDYHQHRDYSYIHYRRNSKEEAPHKNIPNKRH